MKLNGQSSVRPRNCKNEKNVDRIDHRNCVKILTTLTYFKHKIGEFLAYMSFLGRTLSIVSHQILAKYIHWLLVPKLESDPSPQNV